MSARTMTNPVALASFISSGALKIQNGFPCGNWNDKGEGIFHLRPFNVSNFGQIDLRSTKFVETNKNLKAYLLQEGDVIFNNTNSEVLVGKTAFWTRTERSTLSNHMTILRVKEREQLDPEFLSFFLLKKWFDRYFESACRRHVNQASISTEQLAALELPILDVPEQKKIAHILSTVQRAIEAQESIIQTTTELKKALMHKLFTEGIPRRSLGEGGPPRNEPQKQTEIGMIPESWSVLPFDQFVTLQRGHDLRKQDFRQGSVPVIGATQVIGYHDTANVKAPGVTVVRSGSSAGKPLFIAEDFWAHNVLLYVKDFKGNHPRFTYYKILDLDLTQYRQGVAVPTLNRNTFSAVDLALPSPKEQQDIADALDAVGNKTEVAERKKAQLQDLFRTLLHELMTAKTRVLADLSLVSKQLTELNL